MEKASSASVISVPKGGGAIKGIGETFAPDLHTGTGNFTVPIAVPPGRNGFQPQLTLTYSTGNGNGLFGLGDQPARDREEDTRRDAASITGQQKITSGLARHQNGSACQRRTMAASRMRRSTRSGRSRR